jgi:hypothetical protein
VEAAGVEPEGVDVVQQGVPDDHGGARRQVQGLAKALEVGPRSYSRPAGRFGRRIRLLISSTIRPG